MKKRSGKVKTGKVMSISERKVLETLYDNKYGLIVKTIVELTKLPKRTVYNALNRLRKKNLIENIFPIWRIVSSIGESDEVALILKNNNYQLHNISFVIKLIKKPDWWEKRSNNLLRLKEYQSRPVDWSKNNPYEQLIKDNMLIQSFSSSLIFISLKQYWGTDAYDCFIQATRDFLNAYNFFEKQVKFKFFGDGVPNSSIRSQHQVDIENLIAKRCKKTGEKFNVFIDGKLRLLFDKSDPQGLEAVDKDYATDDMEKLIKQKKDILKYDPPTQSELNKTTQDIVFSNQLMTKNIQDIVSIQKTEVQKMGYYAKTIEEHVGAIKDLRTGINEFREALKPPITPPKPPKTPPIKQISEGLRYILNLKAPLEVRFCIDNANLNEYEENIAKSYLKEIEKTGGD